MPCQREWNTIYFHLYNFQDLDPRLPLRFKQTRWLHGSHHKLPRFATTKMVRGSTFWICIVCWSSCGGEVSLIILAHCSAIIARFDAALDPCDTNVAEFGRKLCIESVTARYQSRHHIQHSPGMPWQNQSLTPLRPFHGNWRYPMRLPVTIVNRLAKCFEIRDGQLAVNKSVIDERPIKPHPQPPQPHQAALPPVAPCVLPPGHDEWGWHVSCPHQQRRKDNRANQDCGGCHQVQANYTLVCNYCAARSCKRCKRRMAADIW